MSDHGQRIHELEGVTSRQTRAIEALGEQAFGPDGNKPIRPEVDELHGEVGALWDEVVNLKSNKSLGFTGSTLVRFGLIVAVAVLSFALAQALGNAVRDVVELEERFLSLANLIVFVGALFAAYLGGSVAYSKLNNT